MVKLIEVIDDPENHQAFMVLEYIYGGPVMSVDETNGSTKVLLDIYQLYFYNSKKVLINNYNSIINML